MSTTELEKRLIAVEKEVARLKAEKKARSSHPVRSLEAIHATFENDKAFDEAMQLGRKWRQTQRVNGHKPKAKRK
ncbi:MAG TPA: hypothetical protein VHS31_19540 [Tepidisphaeraceae bacterium]|jgi:hypothetical protein|nr:hypothetical protein [Tepidisphaeraceae bacterium]